MGGRRFSNAQTFEKPSKVRIYFEPQLLLGFLAEDLAGHTTHHTDKASVHSKW